MCTARSVLLCTLKDRLDPGGRTKDQVDEPSSRVDKNDSLRWSRGDVLYDVETKIRRRHGRTLAFPLMFYFSQTTLQSGSESAGSPIIAISDTREHVSTFVIACNAGQTNGISEGSAPSIIISTCTAIRPGGRAPW